MKFPYNDKLQDSTNSICAMAVLEENQVSITDKYIEHTS